MNPMGNLTLHLCVTCTPYLFCYPKSGRSVPQIPWLTLLILLLMARSPSAMIAANASKRETVLSGYQNEMAATTKDANILDSLIITQSQTL